MDIAKSMPERAVRMQFKTIRTLSQVIEGSAFRILRMRHVEGLTDAQIGLRIGLRKSQARELRQDAERRTAALWHRFDLQIDLSDPPDEAGF
jgi:hypothetical protein